jgi:hypothetical protein
VKLLLAILLAAMAGSSLAQSSPYQLPAERQITGYACGVPPAVQYSVTGTDSEGNQIGFAYGYSYCSAGGRGGNSTYISGCVSAVWDSGGSLLSFSRLWVIWQKTAPVPASQCLG